MSTKVVNAGGGHWPSPMLGPERPKTPMSRVSGAKGRVDEPGAMVRPAQVKVPQKAPPTADAPAGQGIAATLAARNKQANLEARWNLVTRALGQGAVPRVRPGEKWSYFFEPAGPGEISYPAAQLAKLDESEALGCLGREIGHWLYSRYPAGKELEQKAFHTLWNAVEAVRINRMVGTTLPGLVDLIRRADAKALDPQIRARLIQQGKTPSRALQMAFAILYEGHTDGERDPLATHPDVRAALDQARPLIADASRLPAMVDLRYEKMSEAQIVAEAERSFAIVRDRLWPIFSDLLAKDLKAPLHKEEAKDKDDPGAPKPEDAQHSETPEIEQEGAEVRARRPDSSRAAAAAAETSRRPPTPKPKAKAEVTHPKREERLQPGEGSAPEQPDEAGGADGARANGGGSAGDAQDGAAEGADAAGDPQKGQGAGAADAAPERQDGASGEGDPWRLPEHDPLEPKHGPGESERAGLEAQLEEVHQQLRRKTPGPGEGANEAESKSPQPEKTGGPSGRPEGSGAKPERPDQPGAGGPERSVGMRPLPKKSLDELLGQQSLTPVKEDQTALGMARWQEIRENHAAQIEGLVRALPTILEARYSRPWIKEYGREGRYDLARELALGWKQEATGVRDPHRRRLRGLPQRTDKPTILVFDVSKSMDGPKGLASQELMVIFTEAFDRANAPNAAFCYNHDVRLLTPPNGVRTPELYGACLNEMACDGGNNELAALDTVEALLGQFGVQDGLVVFVTDTYASEPEKGQESCRDRVLRLERTTGAKVVAVDLSHLGAVQYEPKPGDLPPFPNSKVLDHIEDLPQVFAEVVRDFVDASA